MFNLKHLNKVKDKGFSLVELIVTITILSFVGAVIAAFVGMSMSSYRTNSAEVNIQYQAQLAANQMGNVILSATNGMSYDKSAQTLELYSVETDKAEPDDLSKAHRLIKTFKYEPDVSSVGAIKYLEVRDGAPVSGDDSDHWESFANYITGFDVLIFDKEGNDITETDDTAAGKVEIKLGYENGGRVYYETNVVTLRNEIKLTTVTDSAINAGEFFKGLVTEKITKVNNVEFTTEPGKNYLWVGKQYPLAEINGATVNSPIKGASDASTIIRAAEFNVSNPKAETDYGFEWSYGVPLPKSAEAYIDGTNGEKVPNIVASGEKLMLMIGKDETSPFQVVGTSRESLPNQEILDGDDAEKKKREKDKRTKSDAVMVYPKHISNVSISSDPVWTATNQAVTLRVGFTVKYAGTTETDIENNKSTIIAALDNGKNATATASGAGFKLNTSESIACMLTEIHDEPVINPATGLASGSALQRIEGETKKLDLEFKEYTANGDSVTYYFETKDPYDAYNDDWQRYVCTVVGNTLGLNEDRASKANVTLKVDINKCVLGFTDDFSSRLCAGESITLTPQLTVKSTKEEIKLSPSAVSMSAITPLKGNTVTSLDNFCTFDSSTGKLSIKKPLDGSYSVVIKVEYKKLVGLVKIYADAITFDILKENGEQFITNKENPTQKYEFIPTNTDLVVSLKAYSSEDIAKKKPLDASLYALQVAEDCDSPVNCIPIKETGCKLNFYYNNARYKGTLKLELCRVKISETGEETYLRLGEFQELKVMSDNENVGLLSATDDGGADMFIPTSIREDADLGYGQKTSERYDGDKRINVDYYWYYDVFGNGAGYSSIVKVAGKPSNPGPFTPMIRVKKVNGDTFECYHGGNIGVSPFWIRKGY